MSSPDYKFLLDENVRRELYVFLKNRGIEVKLCPKGLKNGDVARLCQVEKRILVTNDEDFIEFSSRKIPGVIWLRIPQDEPQILIKAFSRLLTSLPSNLKSNLVILCSSHIEFSNLA